MSDDTTLVEVFAVPSRLGEHLKYGNVKHVQPEFQVLLPTPYRAFPGTKDPVTLVAEPCSSACLANVAQRQTINLSILLGPSGICFQSTTNNSSNSQKYTCQCTTRIIAFCVHSWHQQ